MTEPMSVRLRVKAPVAKVHHALTDAGELRTWLAEHAEVKPDRYEFWGRHTPDGASPNQRLLHVDARTLRFSWLLDGIDTTVSFTLEEEGSDATVVTLSHTGLPTYAEMFTETGTRSLMYTFWALSVANLVDHVEGRPLTPKCDFTSTVMREHLTVAAPRGAVFDSLINPEEFSRWFGAHIELEPHVGGRVTMGPVVEGQPASKIVELEPGRKLSVAWTESMITTWELDDAEGGTRLTFVQSGFDSGSYAAWMGNLAGLAELRRYHELPTWRPIRLAVHMEGLPAGMVELG